MGPQGPENEPIQNNAENPAVTPIAEAVIFKPVLDTEKTKNKTTGSFISLILFVIIGYFLWKSNVRVVIIITTVVLIHELGHLLAMKLFNYTNLNIFFIPFFGGAATGRKTKVSQKQETIILLAGPLPGMIIGIILYFLDSGPVHNPWLYGFSVVFILVNLINLLPVYPLDGGRMLKIIFLNKSGLLANIFSVLSLLVILYYAISAKDYVFLFFGFILLMSLVNSVQKQKLVKILKEDGINTATTYDEINKEQYIHIRGRMLQTISAYKNFDLFDFDINAQKEKRLAQEMEQILKPAPANDMNISDKIIITIIWIACFVTTFMLDLPLPFLRN